MGWKVWTSHPLFIRHLTIQKQSIHSIYVWSNLKTGPYTFKKILFHYLLQCLQGKNGQNTVFIVTQCRKKKLPKSVRPSSFDIGHANKTCNAVSSNFSVTKSKIRFIASGKKTKITFVTELNNTFTLQPIWKTNLWTINTKRIYYPLKYPK